MIFRSATEKDLPAITEIENASMTMPWSFCSFAEAVQSDHTMFMVADDEGQVAAFAVFYLMVPEAELPDIVVAEKYRGQGLGKELLGLTIDKLKEQNVTDIYLEVREGNTAAKRLYRSFGFTETGVRKNFYRDPVENAICMHLACM